MHTKTLRKVGPLALGSSLLMLSMIPAAAAFAATNSYISNVTTTANGIGVSATSTTTPPNLKVEYQFWATNPSGHTWILRKFEPSATFKWTPPSSGTFKVQSFALTEYQVAHKDWGAAVAGTTVTDQADEATAISIAGAPTANIGVNTAETLTVTGTDAAGQTVPITATPTWSLPSGTTGATLETLTNGGVVFNATQPGSYAVTATVDGLTATHTIVVYGAPAAVKLSAASTTLVADGVATDTITATVVDANGNTVSDYNGTLDVTDRKSVV